MAQLAQRVREANEVQAELRDIQVRCRELEQEVQNRVREPVAACVYTMYTTYQVHLKKTENQAQQRLTQAERVVERQRRRVVAASKDRKVMDKYKERKKEAYEERQRSAEQVQLDEMAMLARLRRNDEE